MNIGNLMLTFVVIVAAISAIVYMLKKNNN